MSDRPFGFDTLTIPAVLVSDGDPASAQEAAWTVGFDAIRLPAVLVPVGGTPPAGDYVKLGVIARPIKAKVASPTMTPEEQSFPSAPTDEIGPQLPAEQVGLERVQSRLLRVDRRWFLRKAVDVV